MIVVDCSVVVDVLVRPTPELVESVGVGEWHAPALLDVEVVSALRGLVLGRHISRARARDALGDYTDLAVRTWTVGAAFRSRALQLADNLTAYDAMYVVLAEALDRPLATRDAKLAAAAHNVIDVRLL